MPDPQRILKGPGYHNLPTLSQAAGGLNRSDPAPAQNLAAEIEMAELKSRNTPPNHAPPPPPLPSIGTIPKVGARSLADGAGFGWSVDGASANRSVKSLACQFAESGLLTSEKM